MNFTIFETRVLQHARRSAIAGFVSTVLATTTWTGTAGAQEVRVGEPAPPPPNPGQPVSVTVNNNIDTHGAPRVISDWQEGEPIPTGYHPVSRVRKGAIIGGAVPLAAFWFFSALVGAGEHDANGGRDHSGDGLFIPVVGPFITMTQQTSAVGNVFLAFDGVVQSAGLALVVWGIASPKTLLMRDTAFEPGALRQPTLAERAIPRPMLVGRDAPGLGWAGSF